MRLRKDPFKLTPIIHTFKPLQETSRSPRLFYPLHGDTPQPRLRRSRATAVETHTNPTQAREKFPEYVML